MVQDLWVKRVLDRGQWSVFQTLLGLSLAVWPWTSELMSMCLNLLK